MPTIPPWDNRGPFDSTTIVDGVGNNVLEGSILVDTAEDDMKVEFKDVALSVGMNEEGLAGGGTTKRKSSQNQSPVFVT